jgi:hypothetical protein
MRLADTIALTSARIDPDLFRKARDRIDPAWIAAALDAGECTGMRRRKLPADAVVWLVIAACLFAHLSFEDVVKTLGITAPTRRGHAQVPPSSGAVADARARLGSGPMCEVFRTSASHWASGADFDHLKFHGLEVLATDGFTARVSDSPATVAEFGKPPSRSEEAAYPQVRALCVVNAMTHFVLDVAFGPYRSAEIPLYEELIPRLPSHSVTLHDRNFNSYGTLFRIQNGREDRHWLVRAKQSMVAVEVQALAPGDTLVDLELSPQARKHDPTLPRHMRARRITYVIGAKSYTLITSMLDPVRFPAHEIAALYHSRWEVELVFDDVKTELRESALTLRSKAVDGIYQELYGVLIAHNLVRVEMAKAAVLLRVSPTRISFHRALVLICQHVQWVATSSAPSKAFDRALVLQAQLQYLLLPPRRVDRHYPRVQKVVVGRYPRKRIGQPEEAT